MQIPDFGGDSNELLSAERKNISSFKKAILLVAGATVQKLMMQLAKEQEILMNIADMLIDLYIGESLFLRVAKITGQRGEEASKIYLDILNVYQYDAADRLHKSGKDAINSFAEGDEQRMLLMGLKRFTKVAPLNVKEARRRIAAKLIDENKYCF